PGATPTGAADRPGRRLEATRGCRQPGRLLAPEEAEREHEEDREEDDGLLRRHRRAREHLVAERREAPEPLGRVAVDVVDRAREQRKQEPERARERERREEVRGAEA